MIPKTKLFTSSNAFIQEILKATGRKPQEEDDFEYLILSYTEKEIEKLKKDQIIIKKLGYHVEDTSIEEEDGLVMHFLYICLGVIVVSRLRKQYDLN